MAKVWKKIIVSGSDAHLNSITASNSISASGNLFASLSLQENSPNLNTVLYNSESGEFYYTGSYGGTGGVSSGGDGTAINLGEYSTFPDLFPGFFDVFLNTTSVTTALEEISNTISDIAPSKPGVLTSRTLDKTNSNNPAEFTAKLAGGLTSNHWNSLTPHQNNTNFTTERDVRLETPNESSRFRAGKYSNLVPDNVLEGGVTASRSYQNDSFEVIDKVALSSGVNAQGSNNIIKITSLAQYNTLWAKANAKLTQNITENATGSYRYRISADNGAGETNTFQLYYVGKKNDIHFPAPSNVSISDVVVSNVGNTNTGNVMFLSGVKYYTTNTTFTVTVTADNMFNPVYVTGTQVQFSGVGDTETKSQDDPNHDDQLNQTLTITLGSGQSNESSDAATGTIILNKPLTQLSETTTLGNKGVNSKGIVSTDGKPSGTFNKEFFFDEDKRRGSLDGSVAWDSSLGIQPSNLAVVNGRLYHPSKVYPGIDYSAFQNSYVRIFTPPGPSNAGIIEWAPVGGSFNNLSPGTDDNAVTVNGDIEMFLHIQGDTNTYDLGRPVGDVVGNFIGIKNTLVQPNVGDYKGISFAFPEGVQADSTNIVTLRIKYNTDDLDQYITQVNLKF